MQLHPHKELGKPGGKKKKRGERKRGGKKKKEGKLTNRWDTAKALVTLNIPCKTSYDLIKIFQKLAQTFPEVNAFSYSKAK